MSGAKTVCRAIQAALDNDDGALIGRNGSIELDLMIHDAHTRDLRPYVLERNAGVFPMNRTGTLTRWREASTAATKAADVLATGWYEPLRQEEASWLKCQGVTASQVSLRSLEPYYVTQEEQWTNYLSGYKVAVISSFALTIGEQTPRLAEIWATKLIIPTNVQWECINTGYPHVLAQGRAEWPAGINTWEEAIDYIVGKVVASGARFAIIGCGGLGMIIGHRLKERGVISIVMGGAIQVLFGIKGQRWATHDVISTFWNEGWVWPRESETPRGARQVEGGCYWGPT